MDSTAGLRTTPMPNADLPERYEVVRHIATGGMASVWCAEDLMLARRVAIKVLADQFAGDAEAVRRFKREARAAARLSGHPNVVTIYDVGQSPSEGECEHPGRAFIVMEFLSGGTVADALRVGSVSVPQAVQWLGQAAAAIDYAHSCGIVHRDIKPGNFLLDGARRLHVADFGVARLRSEDTITSAGQLFGTAAYLAPEQALGEPATEASDRYALAILAFELLAGERPYEARHFAAQARHHIHTAPPRASERNPSLPAALDAVLMRGMAKDPAARWPSATEFTAAIEEAMAGAPVAPPALAPEGVPRFSARETPPRVFSPRSPARAAAIAALAAAALGAGIVVGSNQDGTRTAARAAALRLPARTRPTPPRRHAPRVKPRPHPAPAVTATTSETPPPPTADALEAQGHQLLLDGNYAAAIPVLRQAVSNAAPGSLTYGYALYDLGRSLILSGNPGAAIPVLEQRLQIPNQIPVVLQTLALARQAAHVQKPPPSAAGGAPIAPSGPAPGHGHHGHGHGGGGGGEGD